MIKNKKQKKWINKISKILIIMSLFYTNTLPFISLEKAEAAGLSTTTPKIYVNDLKIGGTYKVSELTNGLFLKVTNLSATVDIAIQMLGSTWCAESDSGYDMIPDTSWVTADPDYFTDVGYEETVEADLIITIPDDEQYLGKKFYVGVWVVESGFGGTVGSGIIPKLYFSISDTAPIPVNPPTNIEVVDAGTGGQLNLSWTNSTDADFDHIHIYRSTSDGVLGDLVYDDITLESKSDTGLTNGTTYYYNLRSVNTSGKESTNTDQYHGTPSSIDITPPEITLSEIAGLADISPGEKVIIIPDKKVTINAGVSDNNQVTSVKLYYRETGVDSYTNVSFIPAPTGSDVYSGTADIPKEAVTKAGFEYYIEAYDGTNYSYWKSQDDPEKVNVGKITIVTFGIENVIKVLDGETQSVVAELTIPANALSGETEISIEQLVIATLPGGGNLTKSSRPVIAFELSPHGLQFNKPVTLKMAYLDEDSDGLVDATNINEKELSLFYYDGFEWRYLDGTVDVVYNTVTGQINHFSTFALFPAKSLAAGDYRPLRKIITPNGDGTNDVASFSGLSSEINIFDITGRKIRTVNAGVGQWDGKDKDGDVVRNGVYIYQFEVDGELVSGTIAVAK